MQRNTETRPLAALFLAISALLLTGSNLFAESSEGDYELTVGDKLRITVYGHEDLSGEFEVDANGRVSLPLIGDVNAEGNTTAELSQAITAALKPDYLRNPRVSTEVLSYQPFYILGEVETPGSYPYVKGMSVINAVAVAGGFTYRARKGRITIVREESRGTREFDADMDTLLMPGDVINVPERFF